ncbi:ABC transporter permease [Anaeromyxobacter diazotrophicus]|uniref:Multidrug ABC transporter substrate-binding protein n=1 Tax=Anaeromyxobacter diazotrophicus TaxID=2590199 RepID=A0A7I9VLV1_9BACT|nr:ABC transporter permease [Anaeromyxobacter diazotrophicus]GEJ57386.1 multidrug ABC transporter substrate-binding protein [Anaeromyxobacter diazotrophicus]
MILLPALRTALRALRKNKLRSALAMLGIVIAVAAVVSTVSLGQGARAKVAQQMASLGSNLLMVVPGSMNTHGAATGAGATQNLTLDDARAIERELPQAVAAVAPVNRSGAQVVYGDANWFTQIMGSTSAYLTVRQWPLAQGEPFGREEEAAGAKVCLLGQTVKEKLFGEANAVGEQIRVKHVPCKVVGVLAAKGQGSWGQDQDDVVVMPWSTLVRRIQGTQSDAVGMLMVEARGPQLVADAQREVTSLLKQRHRLAEAAEPDFQIRNLTEIQNSANQQTATLSLLLGSIALISLLVGAIGIANVMLVSVTERTREIGIRMAVGARGRDVLFQFLIEAVVLAAIGGLVGLALGAGVSWLMAVKAEWPTLLSPAVMAGTVLLAGLAGVVAGFYPALRASRLDPIDALRYE